VTGFDFREYPYTHPNFNFVQGDVLALPFEQGEYDAVVAISMIEHVGIGFYEDPQLAEGADTKAIDEVKRVLKKGGLFVLTVPYGVAGSNQDFRVYNEEMLSDLLSGFNILKKKCYLNNSSQKVRANAWIEVSLDEGSPVESAKKAECVCLIKAIKD